MIEITIFTHLNEMLSVPVVLEKPDPITGSFVFFEKITTLDELYSRRPVYMTSFIHKYQKFQFPLILATAFFDILGIAILLPILPFLIKNF